MQNLMLKASEYTQARNAKTMTTSHLYVSTHEAGTAGAKTVQLYSRAFTKLKQVCAAVRITTYW